VAEANEEEEEQEQEEVQQGGVDFSVPPPSPAGGITSVRESSVHISERSIGRQRAPQCQCSACMPCLGCGWRRSLGCSAGVGADAVSPPSSL
jgi:hypothetical protein